MGKIIRIAQPHTYEKYEEGISKIVHYHIRKSKSRETAEGIMSLFRQGLNRLDRLNGVVLDDKEKVIGFFLSKLDATVFADIDPNEKKPVILIDHMYCPNSVIEDVYKGLRDKLRKEHGAGSLLMFTHRNPEAWIKFSEKYDVQFEIYGYVLIDRIKEDK